MLTVSYRVDNGQTALHLAARSGYTALLDLLIANGANVNAEDGRGRTPLSYAVERQDETGMKTLLAAKADPNAGSAALPLQVAANSAGEAMVETLLKSGAKPDLARPVPWPLGWNRGGNQVSISDSQTRPNVTPILLAVVAKKPSFDRNAHQVQGRPQWHHAGRNTLAHARAFRRPHTESPARGRGQSKSETWNGQFCAGAGGTSTKTR